MIAKLLILLSFLYLNSCVGVKPNKEYALASIALKMAKQSKASVHAKGLWYKARINFQKAEIAMKDRQFNKARSYFNDSRRYSEKAELLSKLKIKENLSDFELK